MERGALTQPKGPNEVWTIDFKGWFRTGDGQRVEPLTVRDLFSRYGLEVRLLRSQHWKPVRAVLVRLFRRYGVPEAIRVDNGMPFGSTGPAGMSRLSAWWTSLGIRVEFIEPGHPEQNGAHEQFHRVLKRETAWPPAQTARAQQRRSTLWLEQYNKERPHQALGQSTPGQVYRHGRRRYPQRLIEWKYPAGWETRRVRSNGEVKWQGRKRFLGEAFVGMRVGFQKLKAGVEMVYFRGVLLGQMHASDIGGLRPSAYVRRGGQGSRGKV
jgi:putative transposase